MALSSSQFPLLPVLSQQVTGCCCHSDSKWWGEIWFWKNQAYNDNDNVKIIDLTLI